MLVASYSISIKLIAITISSFFSEKKITHKNLFDNIRSFSISLIIFSKMYQKHLTMLQAVTYFFK